MSRVDVTDLHPSPYTDIRTSCSSAVDRLPVIGQSTLYL